MDVKLHIQYMHSVYAHIICMHTLFVPADMCVCVCVCACTLRAVVCGWIHCVHAVGVCTCEATFRLAACFPC